MFIDAVNNAKRDSDVLHPASQENSASMTRACYFRARIRIFHLFRSSWLDFWYGSRPESSLPRPSGHHHSGAPATPKRSACRRNCESGPPIFEMFHDAVGTGACAASLTTKGSPGGMGGSRASRLGSPPRTSRQARQTRHSSQAKLM